MIVCMPSPSPRHYLPSRRNECLVRLSLSVLTQNRRLMHDVRGLNVCKGDWRGAFLFQGHVIESLPTTTLHLKPCFTPCMQTYPIRPTAEYDTFMTLIPISHMMSMNRIVTSPPRWRRRGRDRLYLVFFLAAPTSSPRRSAAHSFILDP